MTPSIVGPGATHPGAAARRAEQAKIRKYAALARAYHFSPMAFETLGGPGPASSDLIARVSEALVRSSGDKRAGMFLSQRLSLEVQRGNAIAVLGTMRDWSDASSIRYGASWDNG